MAVSGKHPRKRPHGNPNSRQVVEKNVYAVQRLLANGASRREIQRSLAKKGPATIRTVDRYIAVARARWVRDLASSRPSLVEQRIARLTHLTQKYEKEGETAAVVQLEKELNTILGVRAPEQHQHAVAVVDAAPSDAAVDVSQLTDDELDALERAVGKLKTAHNVPALPALALATPEDVADT